MVLKKMPKKSTPSPLHNPNIKTFIAIPTRNLKTDKSANIKKSNNCLTYQSQANAYLSIMATFLTT